MVPELIVLLAAMALMALFSLVIHLHQFTIIRRQHEQVVELERLLALRAGDPNVSMYLDRQQTLGGAEEPEPPLRPAT